MRQIILLLLLLGTTVSAQNEHTLSLVQAKDLALRQNPHFQIQLKKVTARQGAYWAEILPENPEAGIELEEIPNGRALENYTAKRIFVSQAFDFPTNYLFKHKLLKSTVSLEKNNLELARRELLFQVETAYNNVLLQQELAELARQNFSLSEDFYHKTKRSFELGESDRLTMLKAKVNWGTSRQKRDAAEKDVVIAQNQLCELLGFADPEPLWLTDSLAVPASESLNPRDFLKNHPAILAAQLAREIARQEQRLSVGKILPQISLTYFRQVINSENFWGGEIGLTLPLWFPKNIGLLRQKKAELDISEQFLRAEELRLQKEVNQALAQLQKAQNEVELFRAELLSEAEEAFRIARRSYEVGEIGYLEFIDAQQILIETRAGYLTALFQFQIEKANLIKLSGKSR